MQIFPRPISSQHRQAVLAVSALLQERKFYALYSGTQDAAWKLDNISEIRSDDKMEQISNLLRLLVLFIDIPVFHQVIRHTPVK